MMAIPSARQAAKEPNKLILCFDGTGNTFSGSNADTNVVKILNKLDRHHPNQYHYYQTGVGTYDVNERSVHKTWLGEMRSSFSKTLDQAIGTTFDSHVMAGYRFLMRYYETGDKIYLFGFSRGAFTARFLARMIHTVGLLCRGNEELVPFAYRLYQRYLAGEIETFGTTAPDHKTTGTGTETEPLLPGGACNQSETTFESAFNEVTAFSNTFCRKERTGNDLESNVKVFFLGMWDCVNSVAVFEGSTPLPVSVEGTANYIRHAVAVDERRVKFKAALLEQDKKCPNKNNDNIKEVWFPGCHGDVGGGWLAGNKDTVDLKPVLTPWQKFKNFWFTDKPKGASKDVRNDAFQMSDVALSWMIEELELIGKLEPESEVKWSKNADGYKKAFAQAKHQNQALRGLIHDSLVFGGSAAFFKVLMWKVMEFLPIISRWEMVDNQWAKVRFPLNKGSYRDIPRNAVLHESLKYRLEHVEGYAPANNHGDSNSPCLNYKNFEPFVDPLGKGREHPSQEHQLYKFQNTDAPWKNTNAALLN